MIEFTTGDILKTDAEALVNTVNCVGIMGRGVALQFKNAFPANFRAYRVACDRKQVQPGRMFIYETGYVGNPKYIINFPTKRHWKGKSRLEDIEVGLMAFVEVVKRLQIHSVAMPPLGSGLGGLQWPVVKRSIEAALKELPNVKVTVFEPRESVALGGTATSPVPNMTAGRAALVALMRRYLDGLLDPFVTLLEVHKLMYFMQEAGEPLRLRYVKAPYGPYAENLRHVLTSIDGYLLAGYGDGGENPGKELTIVPGAAEDAESFLREHSDVQARFSRVADLVQGFETPFGLELLATVHWVTKHERAATPGAIMEAVYTWSDRKKQFTPRQITLAHEALRSKGWESS